MTKHIITYDISNIRYKVQRYIYSVEEPGCPIFALGLVQTIIYKQDLVFLTSLRRLRSNPTRPDSKHDFSSFFIYLKYCIF